jgi:hypothetical protein
MSKTNWLALMLASALLSGQALAEDLTMEIIEDGVTPEDIVSQIQLPAAASAVAQENAEFGLDTANAAREDGRAFGQRIAELRGEQGREIGGAASEARQNAADVAAGARGNRGRP